MEPRLSTPLPGFLLRGASRDLGREVSGPAWDDTNVAPQGFKQERVPGATCPRRRPSLTLPPSLPRLLPFTWASWGHLPYKPPVSASQGPLWKNIQQITTQTHFLSHYSFDDCRVCNDIPPISFLIFVISVFSLLFFSFVRFTRGLSITVSFSENKVLFDFPYCFSVLSSMDFCSYLYYFLLSTCSSSFCLLCLVS